MNPESMNTIFSTAQFLMHIPSQQRIHRLRLVICTLALSLLWLANTSSVQADELETVDEAPPGLIEMTTPPQEGDTLADEDPNGLDNVTALWLEQGCDRDLALGQDVKLLLSVSQTNYYRLVIEKPDGSRTYPMGSSAFYLLYAHDGLGRDVRYAFEGELGMPLGQRSARLERFNGRYAAPSVVAQCRYKVVDAAGATRFGQEIRVSAPISLPMCLTDNGNEAIVQVCNGSSRQLWEVEQLHFDHYAVRTADVPWEQRCLVVDGGLKLQACNGGQEVRFQGSPNSWRSMLDVDGQYQVHITNDLRFSTCWTGDPGFCVTARAGFYFN